MIRYGLKLWSTNRNYRESAVDLHEKGVFDYLELYSVPGKLDESISIWRDLNIPVVVHAPHDKHGMNLGRRDCREANLALAREALRFADQMKAEKIIFHLGINGTVPEAIQQLNEINDSRIVIENQPHVPIWKDGTICDGHSPEQIREVLGATQLQFCLDFGHAICAANSLGRDPYRWLEEFLQLRPAMFHLSDGDSKSDIDQHLHYGRGTYDLKRLKAYLPPRAMVSVESEKDFKDRLDDFAEDVAFLNGLG